AAGGLVSVFVIYIRPDRVPFSSLLGWIGLAGIVAGTFLIRADMPFPGYIAAVPVASTALVILADSRGRASVPPLLSLKPVPFLGDTSHSVSPCPSSFAAVPVASTALVILAASRGRASVLPLLSLKPVRFLGDISYSVYLWHWPLIVLVPYLSAKMGASETLGFVAKTAIVILSI